jgi:hypothetical protein
MFTKKQLILGFMTILSFQIIILVLLILEHTKPQEHFANFIKPEHRAINKDADNHSQNPADEQLLRDIMHSELNELMQANIVFEEQRLRDIVRSELNESPKKEERNTQAIQPTKLLSPEEKQHQQAAVTASTTIVTTAISNRTWTRADSDALAEQLGQMTEEQRREIRNQLFTAINRQEIELKDMPRF